jgi:ankyrin repeat protein
MNKNYLSVIILLMSGALSYAMEESSREPLKEVDKFYLAAKAIRSKERVNIDDLVKQGLDPNSKNEQGDTLLHVAVEYTALDIIYYLIEKGALTNVRNKHGYSPLHYAAGLKHWMAATIVDVLIKNNAFVDIPNNQGIPPLFYAVYNSDFLTVNELIGAGADVNFKQNDLVTPLMCACNAANKEMVSFLIKAGARIDELHIKKYPWLKDFISDSSSNDRDALA